MKRALGVKALGVGETASPNAQRPTPKSRPTGRLLATHLFLLTLVIVTFAPFTWMILTSLKPLKEVESGTWVPQEWRPQNYGEVFRQIPFGRYYVNSLFVACWVTFLQCFTSALAAFAFSRLVWPGRDALFKLYLATRTRGPP